jgi:dienelactone hydrolase
MYLWHWPLYLVITPARTGLAGASLLVVRLASVVALAATTHFFVGEPIRRGVRLRAPQLARLATATSVIVIGASVFLATVGARPALTGDVGELAVRGRPPRTAPGESVVGDAAPLKVLVVGDSQGATLAQGLDAAPGRHGLSAQPGLQVWNRAILGCSITSARTFVIDGELADNRCGAARAWQEQWTRDVAEFDPDVAVVQAGAWDVYDVARPDGTLISPGSRPWRAAYRRDIDELWDVLGAGGAEVVAIRPPCYGRSEVVGTEGGPPERFDPARIAAVEDVWATVARARGDQLLDLSPVLCPRGVSDALIRPDGAHYGDAGSDRIAALVATAVRARATGRAPDGAPRTDRPAEPAPLVSHLTPVPAPSPGGDPDFTWYTHPTPAGRTVTLGVVRGTRAGARPAILVAPSAVGLNVDYLPYARRLAARGFDVAVSCWFAPTITPDLADVLIPCPDAPVYAGIVDDAVPEFDAVVEAAHEVFGPNRELAVLGPSRGAAIAALRASAGRPEPVVLISGRYESMDPVVGAGTDVVARAAGFRAPVLVLHGVADGVIPVAEAQHLEAALRATGADVAARYYEGAGHNLDGEPVARDDMENLVVEFLCARLTCAA